MNPTIDEALINELELQGMTPEEQEDVIAGLYTAFETRMGGVIGEMLTEEQVNEFEKVADPENQDAAVAWLQENIPNYTELVSKEFEAMKSEYKQLVHDMTSK